MELAWLGQLITLDAATPVPDAVQTIRFVLEGSVSVDYGQFVTNVGVGGFFGDEGLGMVHSVASN